jgi:hypothetical protein
MDPWLRELVRTLAAVAVEGALAREEDRSDAGPIGAPQPPSATGCTADADGGSHAQVVPDFGSVRQQR